MNQSDTVEFMAVTWALLQRVLLLVPEPIQLDAPTRDYADTLDGVHAQIANRRDDFPAFYYPGRMILVAVTDMATVMETGALIAAFDEVGWEVDPETKEEAATHAKRALRLLAEAEDFLAIHG